MARRTLYEKVEERNGYKYIRLKSGRLLGFIDASNEMERAETAMQTAFSRMFKLYGQYDFEWLERRVERLEEYTSALRAEIERLKGTEKERERIAALRQTKGRTPEEIATFSLKADELEARLNERSNRR